MEETVRTRSGGAASQARSAYDALKREIVRCRLEPGCRVTRSQLMERYGFGEAAIREALSRLDQEQLVQVLPREGYRIMPVTLKQVHDLFEARMVVELAVARLAAGKVDAEKLRRLDEAGLESFGWSDREGLETYVAANTAFHLTLAEATGNARLVAMMSSILDEMERIMLLSYLVGERRMMAQPSHGELVDLLIAGDGDGAAEAMLRQLQDNRLFVLDAFLYTPSLQDVSLSAALVNAVGGL